MVTSISEYYAENIYSQLQELLKDKSMQEIVFFCAGNHKIWFDSFAPTLAEKLRKNNINCYIYGGTHFAITAENLIEYMDFIKQKHPSACVIVVDNCLTISPQDSGELIISGRSTNVAGLVNDKLFGNISVLLKTHIKSNYHQFLQKQSQIINYFVSAVQKIAKLNINM